MGPGSRSLRSLGRDDDGLGATPIANGADEDSRGADAHPMLLRSGMRVTSDFWVAALTRRVFGEGGFAAVARRGASEAGAVFVITRNRLGQSSLFGPAPQSAYDSARPDDRQFSALIADGETEAVEARLAKEQRFDSDIWVVELEPGSTPVEELLNLTAP